jgi:hypothetical protein
LASFPFDPVQGSPDLSPVAEAPLRFPAGGVGGEPGALELGGPHLDVKGDLVVDVTPKPE